MSLIFSPGRGEFAPLVPEEIFSSSPRRHEQQQHPVSSPHYPQRIHALKSKVKDKEELASEYFERITAQEKLLQTCDETIQQLFDTRKTLAGKCEDQDEEIKQLRADAVSLQAELERLRKDLSKMTAAVKLHADNDVYWSAECKNLVAQLESEGKVREQLKTELTQQETLHDDLVAVTKSRDELALNLSAVQQEIARLQEQVRTFKQQFTQLRQDRDDAVELLEHQLEEARTGPRPKSLAEELEAEAQEKSFADLKARLATSEDTVTTLRADLTESESAVQRLSTASTQRNLEYEALQAELKKSSTDCLQHLETIEKTCLQLTDSQRDRDLLQAELLERDQEIASLTQHVADLLELIRLGDEAHREEMAEVKQTKQVELDRRDRQIACLTARETDLLTAQQKRDGAHTAELARLRQDTTSAAEAESIRRDREVEELGEVHRQREESYAAELLRQSQLHQAESEEHDREKATRISRHTELVELLHHQHKREMSALTRQHTELLEELRDDHKRQVSALTRQQLSLVEEMQGKHDREVQRLGDDYRRREESHNSALLRQKQAADSASLRFGESITSLDSSYRGKLEGLEATNASLLRQIRHSQRDHQAALTSLNEKLFTASRLLQDMEEERNDALDEKSALIRELGLASHSGCRGSFVARAATAVPFSALQSSNFRRYHDSPSEFGSANFSMMSPSSVTPSSDSLSHFSHEHRLRLTSHLETDQMESKGVPSTSQFQRPRVPAKKPAPEVPPPVKFDHAARLAQLAERNKMLPPHLKTDNPTELPYLSPIRQRPVSRRSRSVGETVTPPKSTPQRTGRISRIKGQISRLMLPGKGVEKLEQWTANSSSTREEPLTSMSAAAALNPPAVPSLPPTKVTRAASAAFTIDNTPVRNKKTKRRAY